MKDNLIKVWNHVKKHGWAYFWVMWFGVSTYNITNIVIKVNGWVLRLEFRESLD